MGARRDNRSSVAPSALMATVGFGASDDKAMLAGIGAGSEEALAQVYERHAAHVFAMARRIVGNAAQAADVVEEVFVDLWDRPEAFDPAQGSLRAYLLQLARTRSIGVGRAAGGPLPAPTQDDERESHLVEMTFFEGRSCREVGRALGIPEEEVKASIGLALRRMGSVPLG
ncbi:MAG: hypothetical protein M3N68_11085 [Actinomycetota bacterium]|nr:hypothetical protein [Actinomycetota bacterium]